MSTVAPRPSRDAPSTRRAILPGLLACAGISCVATPLGHLVPVVGAPVFAILIGLLGAGCIPASRLTALTPGHAFAARQVLQASVVVLGTGLSLNQVWTVGAQSLPVMLGSLAVAFVGAAVLGRRMGVEPDVRTLIGVGTGICGASAIAAASSVMKPKPPQVAYALGTIFVFNVAAVVTFPTLGHVLGLSGQAFGLWSGTAVNDMSSVVAASYAFGDGAGPHAIVVKLTRSLMIIPVTVGLALLAARRNAGAGRERIKPLRLVPAFLVGFVVAAALNSVGLIPAGWHDGLTGAGTFLIAIALAGIGLSLRPGDLRRGGVRPLTLGGVLWVLVSVASLALQYALGLA